MNPFQWLLRWWRRSCTVRVLPDRDVVEVCLNRGEPSTAVETILLSRNNTFINAAGWLSFLAQALEKDPKAHTWTGWHITQLEWTIETPRNDGGVEWDVRAVEVPSWALKPLVLGLYEASLKMGWDGTVPKSTPRTHYR